MSKVEKINLLVVTAGASEWDLDGRYSGASDLPMAESSRWEVAEQIGGLRGAELSQIITSEEQACVETASVLAEVCGGKVRRMNALSEVRLGLWEGLRQDEVEDRFPGVSRQWREAPSSVQAPGGEPLVEAQERLCDVLFPAIAKVRDPGPGVGVVLRPMANALVRCALTGVPVDHLWESLESADRAAWLEIDREVLSWRPNAARARTA